MQGVSGSSPLVSTSRRFLHPVIDGVQCNAKLHIAITRFEFKFERSPKTKRHPIGAFLSWWVIGFKAELHFSDVKFGIVPNSPSYNEKTILSELLRYMASRPSGLVEPTGIEPVSKGQSIQLSPQTVNLLNFPCETPKDRLPTR